MPDVMTKEKFSKHYNHFGSDSFNEDLSALLRNERAAAFQEAAELCAGSWNDTEQVVNQKRQVETLAMLIREL